MMWMLVKAGCSCRRTSFVGEEDVVGVARAQPANRLATPNKLSVCMLKVREKLSRLGWTY